MASATILQHSQLTFEPVVDERESFIPFMPEQIWIDRAVADHPETLRILNRLPAGTLIDVIENISSFRHAPDARQAKRALILTKHRGQTVRRADLLNKQHLAAETFDIHLLEGTPLDCSYHPLPQEKNSTPCLAVDAEVLFADIAAKAREHSQERIHLTFGKAGDGLIFEPLTENASLLAAFAASKANLLLEIFSRSAALGSLPMVSQRRRTVINWFLNRSAVIETEERGTATLEQRLAAARYAASIGFPIGFSLDPIVILGEEDIQAYEELIDRIFMELRPLQISWVNLGFLRYRRDLVDQILRRFPETRLFRGEAIPQHQMMVAPRFTRERVYQRLWTKLAGFLPPQKLFLMDETAEVWQKFAPAVIDQPTLQQRWRIVVNEL